MFQRILLLWLLGTVSALAQTGAVQGHSFVGGTPSVTSGLKSANYLDGIIPHATITVYFTGTTNLVPGSQIFSNSTGTVLGNPFTSNDISSLNPGGWLFFAAQGQGYDVVGSGGLSPNTYGAPTPLCTDCFASGGGGGGGCSVTGTANYFVFWDGTNCVTSTIDEGSTASNTTTTNDQNIKLWALNGPDSEINLQADGEDGIQMCTVAGGGVSCPPAGNNGDIYLNSGNFIYLNSSSYEYLNSGLYIYLNSASYEYLNSGSYIDSNATTTNTLEASTGPIEIQDTTGGISEDTTGGISLSDTSPTGIAIDEGGTGSLSLAANAIALYALADTDVTINSEIVCTAANGECPGAGVSSINANTGAFTFSFSAGAGSCSGTTCTFTGSGSGGGSVTNFIASSGSWPTWLVPSVATSTTTPTLSVSASAIPNSALANVSTTVNGQTCTLGSSCTISGVSSVAGDGTLINSTPQTGAVALTLVYTPAHSGANSDITSLAGLTTALSVPQGGTGAATNTGYLIGHGTSATTSSATIPGSVISSDITHNAANLSAAALLPTGTTAATPSVNDNSAKLATTAYVNSPGNISPTSVTVTGSGPSTLGLTGTTYSALTTAFPCASNAGKIAFVTDSTTQVWGAAYTGGGALPAFVGCDGSAYGVIGK